MEAQKHVDQRTIQYKSIQGTAPKVQVGLQPPFNTLIDLQQTITVIVIGEIPMFQTCAMVQFKMVKSC